MFSASPPTSDIKSDQRARASRLAFVAAFFALSSPSAMADNQLPSVSDEQLACAGAASQDFDIASAAISAFGMASV
jgi:hypothetical protein